MSGRKRRRPPPRPRADQGDTRRVKMPSGGVVTITAPPAELLELAARGEAPPPEAVLAWLAEQPPEYAAYALELLRSALDVHQALAAQAEAAGAYEPLMRPAAAGPSLPVIARLIASLRAGEVGACKHVRAAAPAPATLLAWAPDKVRCRDCTDLESARIAGTREDRRCDQCGTIQPRLSGGVAYLGPVDIHGVMVPVAAPYGLCRRCAEAAAAAGALPSPRGIAARQH